MKKAGGRPKSLNAQQVKIPKKRGRPPGSKKFPKKQYCKLKDKDNSLPDIPYTPAHFPSKITLEHQSQISVDSTL